MNKQVSSPLVCVGDSETDVELLITLLKYKKQSNGHIQKIYTNQNKWDGKKQ